MNLRITSRIEIITGFNRNFSQPICKIVISSNIALQNIFEILKRFIMKISMNHLAKWKLLIVLNFNPKTIRLVSISIHKHKFFWNTLWKLMILSYISWDINKELEFIKNLDFWWVSLLVKNIYVKREWVTF